MSIAAIIVKIMPDSPDSDLSKIEESAKSTLEPLGAQNISFSQEPVAFGLKAIMVKFAWPEEKDTSLFEDALSKIPHVSSAVTSDYRRAFG
jgi:translation elongation factor aEF-1 beta